MVENAKSYWARWSHFIGKKADLGDGAIFPTLLRMSIPAIGMMLLNTLFHLVDTVFVSWLGEPSMVAISITFPVWIALFAMLEGVGGGTTALVGRYLGEGKERTARVTAISGLGLGYFFCLLGLPLLFPSFSEWVLNQLGAAASAEVLQNGYDYNFWLPLIAPLATYTYVSNCIFRCQGDTITPLIGMVIANGVNAVLDPIFIFTLKMGIGGAAAATFVGRLFAVAYIYKKMQKGGALALPPIFSPRRLFFLYWKPIFTIGFPVALATGSVALGFGVINNLLSGFGHYVVAGWMIGIRVEDFYFMIAMGVASALTPFIAFNYGRKNLERMCQGLWAAALISIVIMTVLGSFIVLFPHPFVALFRPTEEAAAIAIRSMRINIAGYLFVIAQFMLGAFFVGTGRSAYGTVAQITRSLVVRLPAAYYFAQVGGLALIWWFQPVSWLVGSVLAFIFFRIVIVNLRHEFSTEE